MGYVIGYDEQVKTDAERTRMKRLWHKILVALRIRKKLKITVRWYPENPRTPGWVVGPIIRGPLPPKDKEQN